MVSVEQSDVRALPIADRGAVEVLWVLLLREVLDLPVRSPRRGIQATRHALGSVLGKGGSLPPRNPVTPFSKRRVTCELSTFPSEPSAHPSMAQTY
ncbi:hypothetical protein ADK74_07545 [Streptomyces decoyicus]|nr:hypothetical protein ADK74_07545 [Streptomyces decoyicus]